MEHSRSEWQGALIVCRKCSQRMDGGFGTDGKQSLAKALRKATGGGRGRQHPIGIIESKCLGVCPSGAAVVIDSAAPDSWWLLKRGTDVETALAEIMQARHGGSRADQPEK